MLGYATLGTNDLGRATGFYDELLKLLGARQMMTIERGVLYGAAHPELGVITPFDGGRAQPGNGNMVGLMAPTREVIDQLHAKALALGGKDEGAPGVRGPDPNGFYAAYFRDLDGNKLCVFRMGPP